MYYCFDTPAAAAVFVNDAVVVQSSHFDLRLISKFQSIVGTGTGNKVSKFQSIFSTDFEISIHIWHLFRNFNPYLAPETKTNFKISSIFDTDFKIAIHIWDWYRKQSDHFLFCIILSCITLIIEHDHL